MKKNKLLVSFSVGAKTLRLAQIGLLKGFNSKFAKTIPV